MRARSALPGYVETEQPVLAWPVVRHVGEALAAVVGDDRYAAEDAAALVRVDYEPLPAAVDVLAALRAGAPLVHDAARGNVLLTRRFEQGDVEAALAGAAVVVERTFRTNRQMCRAAGGPRRRRRLERRRGPAHALVRHAGAAPRAPPPGRGCSACPRTGCGSSPPTSAAASA